ncbi:hypothetical protein CRENBAI_012033, partial [Crenichthys baileyi]
MEAKDSPEDTRTLKPNIQGLLAPPPGSPPAGAASHLADLSRSCSSASWFPSEPPRHLASRWDSSEQFQLPVFRPALGSSGAEIKIR